MEYATETKLTVPHSLLSTGVTAIGVSDDGYTLNNLAVDVRQEERNTYSIIAATGMTAEELFNGTGHELSHTILPVQMVKDANNIYKVPSDSNYLNIYVRYMLAQALPEGDFTASAYFSIVLFKEDTAYAGGLRPVTHFGTSAMKTEGLPSEYTPAIMHKNGSNVVTYFIIPGSAPENTNIPISGFDYIGIFPMYVSVQESGYVTDIQITPTFTNSPSFYNDSTNEGRHYMAAKLYNNKQYTNEVPFVTTWTGA